MYCSKCGKKINDDALICMYCGCKTQNFDAHQKQEIQNKKAEDKQKVMDKYSQSKAGIGFLCCFFLGVIGLIIGIALYPEGTVSRKTFIKSWLITLIVIVALVVLSCIILFSVIFI